MRVFDHPDMDGFRCPICGKSDDKPVVLIGIAGTENGNIIGGRQYHLDCIELNGYNYPSMTVLSMWFKNKGGTYE